MKKLCLFILSLLIIFSPGCNKADMDENISNNNSKPSAISDSDNNDEPKEFNIDSHMGLWYVEFSEPQSGVDGMDITKKGINEAETLYCDQLTKITFISDDVAVTDKYGTLNEYRDRYTFKTDHSGEERLVIETIYADSYERTSSSLEKVGYRTVPSYYESKTEGKQSNPTPAEETVTRLKNSKKVWQHFDSNTEIPEYELIIESVNDESVIFSLSEYRIDSFMSKHGNINYDGSISFNNISGDFDNAALSGTIAVNDGSIVLTVTDSSHPYIEKGLIINFTNQADESILQ